MSKKIILIAGPPASGKSKLAISLAQKIKGEILNADSMQIYKNFNILSSRPDKKDLKKINHHLYGFLSVKKNFSVGEWLTQAKKSITYCLKRRKVPIIVGGTGLYFNSITKGISKIPKISEKKRIFVRNLHKRIGQKNFYNKLIKIDPLVEGKISPTDTQRSMRAYEVIFATKKSIFKWAKKTKSDFLEFDIKKFYLDIPKEILLKKIEKRTDSMFKRNCILEVKKFLKLKCDKSLSANKMIGVPEISNYLSGNMSLDQAKQMIIIRTRQYAKRQKTWSRGHMKNWEKIYLNNTSILVKKILKAIS